MDTISEGAIVRTPPLGVEKEGIMGQPQEQHGVEGEVIRHDGGTGTDCLVDVGDDGRFWWSPEDLTVVGDPDVGSGDEDEDGDSPMFSGIEEGDMIRPEVPADWNYGSTDLSENGFYRVVNVTDSKVTVEDEVGDETFTQQESAIQEVRHQQSFEQGEVVQHEDGRMMTIVSNPHDVPCCVFASVGDSDDIVQVDMLKIDKMPDMPFHSIGSKDHEINYSPTNDVFTVGCISIEPDEVLQLAKWYEEAVR